MTGTAYISNNTFLFILNDYYRETQAFFSRRCLHKTSSVTVVKFILPLTVIIQDGFVIICRLAEMG